MGERLNRSSNHTFPIATRDRVGYPHQSSPVCRQTGGFRPGPSNVRPMVKRVGEQVLPDVPLCPIMVFKRNPTLYVRPNFVSLVREIFLTDNAFWGFYWELYYIYNTPDASPRTILFVTIHQIQDFLDAINQKLGPGVAELDADAEAKGLVFIPDYHPYIVPRYLGSCEGRVEHFKVAKGVPPADYRPSGEVFLPQNLDVAKIEIWTRKMERISALIRVDQDRAPKPLGKTQLRRQRERRRTLEKIKMVMGLHLTSTIAPSSIHDELLGRSADMQILVEPTLGLRLDNSEANHEATTHGYPSLIDSSCVPPYPIDTSVVLVAMDVEMHERRKEVVTEIGISILDCMDLVKLAPGQNGGNWAKKIKARHLRVEEHFYHVNRRFVSGCPDNFEFGTSERVPQSQLRQALISCLQPFLNRKIILVGHSFDGDLRVLKSAGCDMWGILGSFDVIDTTDIHRALHNQLEVRSLAKMLSEFGIVAWFLHNAGNDAFYTLQVLLAMVVKAGELGAPQEESGADQEETDDENIPSASRGEGYQEKQTRRQRRRLETKAEKATSAMTMTSW